MSLPEEEQENRVMDVIGWACIIMMVLITIGAAVYTVCKSGFVALPIEHPEALADIIGDENGPKPGSYDQPGTDAVAYIHEAGGDPPETVNPPKAADLRCFRYNRHGDSEIEPCSPPDRRSPKGKIGWVPIPRSYYGSVVFF